MTTASHPTSGHPTTDREALSALFDGELAGDAARFALKRLDHDQDWRDSCERWQVVGDVLRGAANPRMPSTFAARVHDALRAAAPVEKPQRSRRWGTVALAASAAVVAFFLARLPLTDAPVSAPTVASTANNSAPARDVAAVPAIKHVPQAPQTPDQAGDPSDAQLVGASVALASATRQASQRRTPQRAQRGAGARDAARAPVTADASDRDVDLREIAVADVRPASAPNVLTTAPTATPFDANAARPWPRAVLPQYNGSAALSTDYVQAPSFYPFTPHVPENARATPAANEDVAPTTP
jgi:negative regulator of sigma E activity